MKLSRLEIVGLLGGIASIVGVILTVAVGWSQLVDLVQDFAWNAYGFLMTTDIKFYSRIAPWFMIFFGTIAVSGMVYGNLRDKGGVAGRISLRAFFCRLDPKRTGLSILTLHQGFEHEFMKICRQLHRNPELFAEIDSEFVKEQIARLLNEVKAIVQFLTGADIAIHIKLFEGDHQLEDGAAKIAKAKARGYTRVSSNREKLLRQRNKLRARANDEVFHITPGASKAKDIPPDLRNHGSVLKFNTAYNYVFGHSPHFWVCNDLADRKKAGVFDSSSTNWEEYYRSLAVFLISYTFEPGEHVDPTMVRGLLITDSWEKGIFEEQLTRQLLGFFAHRFYELFVLIERTTKVAIQRRTK